MKRKITFLSAALMLLAFLAVPLGMRGQTTHTIGWGTASGEEGTYTNFTATSGEVAGVLSFITEKNSSQTNPAYNANASELRLYFHSSGDGGSITISPVSGITITDAVMTTSTSPSVAYYVDGGSAVSVSASNNTYTISGISASTSLKIQNVNTSNTQLRIKTIALTYTTDGTQPTTYTVTYHANVTGIDDVVDTYNEGANVTLRAANTFTNEGYTFEEWNTQTDGDGDSYAAGDEIEDIQDDLEFYAIWTENVTPTPGGEVVDVLNLDFTGRPATSSYGDWSDKTGNSGAIYAGNSAGSNNSIQLRSNNNTSGIVTTTSSGKVTKVSVTWNSNTVSGRTLNVYGKDSAYSAASDLYGNDAGTLIGTIVCGTSTELNITNDYEFIGLRSASGAMYLDEIDITWTSGSNPAVATTTVINVPEGFNTDIYQGTEAGTLTATVSAGETTLEASVTWTSSNEAVATIDENGNVTLVAVGNTTITASYAGEDGVYRPSTATYQLTVVNTDPNVPGTQNNPYTVAQARAAIDAGTGVNGVYATGIVSEIPTAWSTQYNNITFNFVDTEGDTDFLQAFRCVSGTGVDASTVAVGDIVVVYGDLIYYTSQGIYEFAQGCQLVSLTHPAIPHITVTPSTIDAPAEGAEGTLVLAYENITDFISFDFSFCDANGGELQEDPDWIDAEIRGEDSLYYVIGANTSDARTAYIKVYTFDDDLEEVYAIVTVNQAEYVAPALDYATLPFAFNGGRADIENTDGLTQEGLGTDYNANTNPNTKLKFDGSGDWMILHFNEEPGTLTFDIKGNSFSGGTFTVQTSEDGVTYTDLDAYTELGDVETKTFGNLGENVRYIKWIYTEKSNGNVGLGNIHLYEVGGGPAFITVEPDILNVDAEQHLVNYFSLTYENIVADSTQCFTVHYYNAEGQEIEPVPGEAWMIAGVVKPMDIYQVLCTIIANEGEARTGYFKVSAQDANDNTVYSNLVTVNQEAAPQQYTLTVAPFENLELITFVNDEMVMEADSTIYVTESDQIMLSIVADEGYVLETLMVNGVNHVNDIADDFTYSFEMPAENVTISATAVEDIPGEWVMVSLNDLTEDDVFVIVGVYDEDESSYAMPNNNGTNNAPSAVEVTMVGNTLSGDIADNLKWNLSIGEGGYTFYPEGDTATWLYCNNTNNGVRMGTNENNVFSMTSEGYLYNNATNRYIGIYNYQDWRCYTSINNNIKNQTFAFYKRVDESEIETYTLDITGYGDNEGGYYLIASPVSMIRPTAENGFLTDEYDLYYFDQAQQGEEWRNYKAKHFNIASGKGYLYASQESTTLIFTGVPYNGNGEVALDYTEGASFAGWNLIGNPFGNAATIDKAYYRLNADGSEVNATTESSAIAAMEGVFVVAETVGETVTFTEQTNPNNNNEVSQISINVSMNRGESIDRAIVRFDNGNQLPKFQLNPNHTKVYFPQGENDYAIVRSANEGEMPVNFKAENNGTYTISINTENVEMDYLHLIDNMTGADVDLLANPSYSFEAKTTDYANRFRLVFNANTVNENGNETFAYFNGSEWVISNMGEATLQVVDMMGRVLSTETVNGNATMNLNQTPGVYMLRLVNGDSMKVQKVVVR